MEQTLTGFKLVPNPHTEILTISQSISLMRTNGQVNQFIFYLWKTYELW